MAYKFWAESYAQRINFSSLYSNLHTLNRHNPQLEYPPSVTSPNWHITQLAHFAIFVPLRIGVSQLPVHPRMSFKNKNYVFNLDTRVAQETSDEFIKFFLFYLLTAIPVDDITMWSSWYYPLMEPFTGLFSMYYENITHNLCFIRKNLKWSIISHEHIAHGNSGPYSKDSKWRCQFQIPDAVRLDFSQFIQHFWVRSPNGFDHISNFFM